MLKLKATINHQKESKSLYNSINLKGSVENQSDKNMIS